MSISSERPLYNTYILDESTKLKDAGAVAASAAAQVDAADQILNVGTGKIKAVVVIDATAVEVDSGDELYTIIAEFSNTDDFSGDVAVGAMQYLGDASAIPGGGNIDLVEGRYALHVTNVINDVHYEYMRLYTVVEGTIATGIDYVANLTSVSGV